MDPGWMGLTSTRQISRGLLTEKCPKLFALTRHTCGSYLMKTRIASMTPLSLSAWFKAPSKMGLALITTLPAVLHSRTVIPKFTVGRTHAQNGRAQSFSTRPTLMWHGSRKELRLSEVIL